MRLESLSGDEPLGAATHLVTRTDAQLLATASKDPLAFREFYDRYAAWVRSWFLRQTGSDSAALDLTAETFAQAWHASRRFRDMADGSGAPWLFGIARNLLRQYTNTIESRAPPVNGSACRPPGRIARTTKQWTSAWRPAPWRPLYVSRSRLSLGSN